MTEQEARRPTGPTGKEQQARRRAAPTGRAEADTVKIPAEVTGLNAACYLHIETDAAGRLCGVSLSSPGKFDGGAIDRLFGFLNGELEGHFTLPAAASTRAFLERHNALRAALGGVVPLLAQAVVEAIACGSLRDGDGWVPGSCEPEVAADFRPDIAALQAACDALGEPLPREVADILPALPPSNEGEETS